VLVALLGGLLILLSFLPLRGTDLWCHVIYGQWILQHGALPLTDPTMPLAEGMRVVDTAWLAQVVFAAVEQWGGAIWLSNLFAAVVWLSYVILARVFYLQSGRISIATAGLAIALAVGWSRLTTIRPENFGLLCFALLLWLLAGSRYRPAGQLAGDPLDRDVCPWRLCLATMALMVAWANLHGSFLCGLALVGCFALGRAIDVAATTPRLTAVLTDRAFQRWTYLLECAALVTLLNPYGLDLWIEVLGFAGKPALRDVVEWAPLVLTGPGGVGFVVALVLLLAALRWGRARLEPWQALALGVFGAASCWQVRMLGWLAPIVALIVVPQLAEIAQRLLPRRQDATPAAEAAAELPASPLPPGRSWRYSLLALMLAWTAFALSGFSAPVLGGAPRSPASLYGRDTPLALTEWLKENPRDGLTFNPQWWGDWLVWAGPPGFEPFMTTNMHLVPRAVWNDYRRISLAEPGWDGALDRYNIQSMVIDRKAQPLLGQAMRRHPGWQRRYEDEQAQVYVRAPRNTTGNPSP
jgi:hypothetical protein